MEEIDKEFGANVRNIVAEVTDDKTLPKQTRKLLQIEHAPTSSHEAKLVKLADKLYNLRDLEKAAPVNWTEERVKEYFAWAKRVVDGLRNTNQYLEKSLDEVFQKAGLM